MKQTVSDVMDAPLDDAHKVAIRMESASKHKSVQPADSPSLVRSIVASPTVADGSSVDDSRTTSAAQTDDDVIVLSDGSDDEDAPESAAPSAQVKAEPLDVSTEQAASADVRCRLKCQSQPRPELRQRPSTTTFRTLNPRC